MSDTPLSKDPGATARRLLAWLESPEGKAASAESEQRIRETEELLANGRDIDWRRLHEPFTI